MINQNFSISVSRETLEMGYEMCNMAIATENTGVMTATSFGIKNEKLAQITNEIIGLAFNMRLYGLTISARVAYIRDNKDELLTEFDGDFVKFAENVLGLKAAQAYAMASVGHNFLDSDGNCLLPEPNETKFNKTQLQALLPLVTKDGDNSLAYDLVEAGEITPSMTVANIKKVVAENRPDAEAIAARKEKAEKAKAEKEKAKETADRAIHGDLVATIEVRKLLDGKVIVHVDGKECEDSRLRNYLAKYYK